MRGYPDGPLTKRDYENLLAMPEHADRAKADLARLAETDDSKTTVDQGTEKSPKLVEIDNPMPAWKMAGFKDKDELLKLKGLKVTSEETISLVCNSPPIAEQGETPGPADSEEYPDELKLSNLISRW